MRRVTQPVVEGGSLALLCLCWLVTSCGGQSASPQPAAPSPEPSKPVATATARWTQTKAPTPEATRTPSATPTPGPPIQFIPWPEQGDLLLPSAIEVTFEASLDDLPQGGYVLRWESRTLAGQIQAVSFPRREVTVLASAPGLDLFYGLESSNFAGSTYVFPVGGTEHKLDVLDLKGERTWRLGPVCDVGLGGLSPSGQYFLSHCDPSCPACANDYTPGVPPDFKVFEVISVTEGTGFRVALPSKDERDPVRLSWFGEQQLIASRVCIDEQFAVCVIDVDEQSARCPYSSKSGYVAASDVAAGETVPLVLPPGPGSLEGLIMPSICLMRGDCDGILDLGEIQGGLYMSPSGQTILLYSTLPSEHTLAAFLEPPEWQVERLIEINGNYVFDAWCPDEACVFVQRARTPFPVYRLDRDGSLTFYPYDNIIASFNIP